MYWNIGQINRGMRSMIMIMMMARETKKKFVSTMMMLVSMTRLYTITEYHFSSN